MSDILLRNWRATETIWNKGLTAQKNITQEIREEILRLKSKYKSQQETSADLFDAGQELKARIAELEAALWKINEVCYSMTQTREIIKRALHK